MWPLESLTLLVACMSVSHYITLGSHQFRLSFLHPFAKYTCCSLEIIPFSPFSTMWVLFPLVPASPWRIHPAPASTRTFFLYLLWPPVKQPALTTTFFPSCLLFILSHWPPPSFHPIPSAFLNPHCPSYPALVPRTSCLNQSFQFFNLHWPLSSHQICLAKS